MNASDHQAAHLLQNAINSWTYGSPRSLAITLEHFTRVHEAVHSSAAAATAASSRGAGQAELDLSTLAGVMQVSAAERNRPAKDTGTPVMTCTAPTGAIQKMIITCQSLPIISGLVVASDWRKAAHGKPVWGDSDMCM